MLKPTVNFGSRAEDLTRELPTGAWKLQGLLFETLFYEGKYK